MVILVGILSNTSIGKLDLRLSKPNRFTVPKGGEVPRTDLRKYCEDCRVCDIKTAN